MRCRHGVSGFVLACWILLSSVSGWAAVPEPSITAELNRAQVWVQDEVELTITVTLEGDLTDFQASDIGVPDIPGLQKDPSRNSTSQNLNFIGDQQQLVYTVRSYFVPQVAGTYELGPIELRYLDGATPKLARAPGPTLLVQAPGTPAEPPPSESGNPMEDALDTDEGMRDIKGIAPAPLDFGLVFTIAGFIALLALAWLIFLMLRKKQPQEEPAAEVYVAPLGLLQRTLQRLEAIQLPASLGDEQAVADYYLAITDLAKEYLGERYGIDAAERTTWELRQEYRQVITQRRPELHDELVHAFRECFELCDGGKYAHLHATYPLMSEAKTRAKQYFESDQRLPAGGEIPIGVQPPPSAPTVDEPGLEGAATGMRIRGVVRRESGAADLGRAGTDLPRATRMAQEALQAPSTSSTLFTPADSAALVNRLADPAGSEQTP